MLKPTFYALVSLLVVLLSLSFEKSLSTPVTGLYRRMDSPPGTPPNQILPRPSVYPGAPGRHVYHGGQATPQLGSPTRNQPLFPDEIRARNARYARIRAMRTHSIPSFENAQPTHDPFAASTSGTQEECSVCLERKVSKECYYSCQNDKQTGHRFCDECVLKWEEQGKESCPMCRGVQNDEKMVRLIDSKTMTV